MINLYKFVIIISKNIFYKNKKKILYDDINFKQLDFNKYKQIKNFIFKKNF